jgi:amino acid transporter
MADDKSGIGLRETASIGIGGMIGGGIFAVLGLAVQAARGGTALAFGVAGVLALITATSYAHLSVRFPSQGGTVSYLDRAFGSGVWTGSLNVLLWLSYVVMLSIYAHAFGAYGATFLPSNLQAVGRHGLISAAIVVIAGLNLASAELIGRAEDWIVAIKLTILGVFVVVGLHGIEGARLAPSTWSPTFDLIAGGMLIFIAYEGFELIANAGGDVRDPEKTLPRAFYLSVGFVLVLYVLIALVTVGNLSLDAIAAARDYVLAEAAKPFLGQAGFVMITVAALLSTASAINATLYGSARLSYTIARDGELPSVLEKKVWNRPAEGLLVTTGAALLVANLFDLSSISTMGSAGFLIIFGAVNGAAFKLAGEMDRGRALPLLGIVGTTLALIVLVWHAVRTAPSHVWVLVAMVALAFGVELIYRLASGRQLRLTP